MNIDKAIEILILIKTEDWAESNVNFEAAVQLGIEALERIKYQREKDIDPISFPLTGETEN